MSFLGNPFWHSVLKDQKGKRGHSGIEIPPPNLQTYTYQSVWVLSDSTDLDVKRATAMMFVLWWSNSGFMFCKYYKTSRFKIMTKLFPEQDAVATAMSKSKGW